MAACNHTCQSQCDGCHDLDNCVEAVTRYGDLLLCRECRQKYPPGRACFCWLSREYCEVHGGYEVY